MEFVDEHACVDGGSYEVADLKRANDSLCFDPVESAADGATTLGAIGSAAEDARFDATL